MRQKRAKAYKRLMNLYSATFGFRQPFQVLVCADFMIELENKQLDVNKQISTCVQGETKPMMTQCSMQKLYERGREGQATVDIAKTFERRRCNHREALEEVECITQVVGDSNKHRYTLACQSKKLRQHLRSIPGVPIIHFNDRGVMVLEPPSEATNKHKDSLENKRLTEQLATNANINLDNIITGPDGAGASATTTAPPRSRKTGPKAPNPLSMRKGKEAPKGRLSKKELQARSEAGKKQADKRKNRTTEFGDEEGPSIGKRKHSEKDDEAETTTKRQKPSIGSDSDD